jgi:putative transposase
MNTTVKPGWHRRGYLPHRDTAGLLQHIVLSALADVRLDIPLAAAAVERALLARDGGASSLRGWAVMPDHVHVAVTFAPTALMGQQIRAWKGVATRDWQTRTGGSARLFSADYFDRYARTPEQADRLIGYIETNPVQCGLVLSAWEWRWSSAWHRQRGRVFDRTWMPFFLPDSCR